MRPLLETSCKSSVGTTGRGDCPRGEASSAADGKSMLRFDQLLEQRAQIQAELQGKIPEHLVKATAMLAMRFARQPQPLASRLSPQVLALVREELRQLARRGWTSDTVVLLQKRLQERGDHGSEL